MSFSIPGFGPNYLKPAFAALLVFGAGVLTSAQQPMFCLVVGQPTAAGTMTANQDVLPVFGIGDVDGFAGWGSQLDLAAEPTFTYPGVQTVIAAVPDPAGTAATATILFAGTATAPGVVNVWVGGKLVQQSIATGDTAANVAANLNTTYGNVANSAQRMAAAATVSTATVTLTNNNLGASGKQVIVFVDTSQIATGITVTVTGSATVGGNANRVFMGATATGTGTETVTTILTFLTGARYARIASCQIDATSAAAWLTQCNAKAAATVLLLDQVHFGQNGLYATAQTLAKTTLNGPRATVAWAQNLECHPSVLAASIAAARAVNEQGNPLFYFDGFPLSGVPGQRFAAVDNPTDSQANTALQNGVCPITTVNGVPRVIRGITTKCVTNSLADYRTIDWGDVAVPDQFTLDVQAYWVGSFVTTNPVVIDNPPPGSPDPPTGLAYPALWDIAMKNIMQTQYAPRLIRPITDSNSQSYLDGPTQRIMCSAFIVPNRLQHQLGARILQVAPY